MFKTFLFLQITFTFIVLLIFEVINTSHYISLSYFIGSVIGAINNGILVWGMNNIFAKKYIAFSMSLIILKWLLIALLIYKAFALEKLNIISFLLGMITFLPTTVMAGYYQERIKKN